LQNLVGNAIKFRRADPLVIDISAASRGAMIEIAVADNGIGIEPEYADRVFEMFYRLHNEESYEGTGIGLTVCQQIVNDHGGEIHVDKNYRGGTKIVMTLPAAGVPDAVEFNPASSSGDAATAA
jgi:signal transduction histidine kinase